MIKDSQIAGFTLFYLEKTDIDNKEQKLELKTKIIPVLLYSKFIDRYGTDLLTLYTSEIDEFIRNNGIS